MLISSVCCFVCVFFLRNSVLEPPKHKSQLQLLVLSDRIRILRMSHVTNKQVITWSVQNHNCKKHLLWFFCWDGGTSFAICEISKWEQKWWQWKTPLVCSTLTFFIWYLISIHLMLMYSITYTWCVIIFLCSCDWGCCIMLQLLPLQNSSGENTGTYWGTQQLWECDGEKFVQTLALSSFRISWVF